MPVSSAPYTHHTHEFPPIYRADSRLLLLGSFPSVKSRAQQFYYGHPQNRFWKVLAGVLQCAVPETVEEKTAMLLAHHIAVWDVIDSCDIVGSSDSSIKNVVATDIAGILPQTQITHIYANGATAKKLYDKYTLAQTGIAAVGLPSTSPANAAWSLERLMKAWQVIC